MGLTESWCISPIECLSIESVKKPKESMHLWAWIWIFLSQYNQRLKCKTYMFSHCFKFEALKLFLSALKFLIFSGSCGSNTVLWSSTCASTLVNAEISWSFLNSQYSVALPVAKLPVNSIRQLSFCLISRAKLCLVSGSTAMLLCCLIYAELSGDFPLGDSRQPTYKSLRPFDLVS